MVSHRIGSLGQGTGGNDCGAHLGKISQIKADDNRVSGRNRQGDWIADSPLTGGNEDFGLTAKGDRRKSGFHHLCAGQSQGLAGFIGGRRRSVILQSCRDLCDADRLGTAVVVHRQAECLSLKGAVDRIPQCDIFAIALRLMLGDGHGIAIKGNPFTFRHVISPLIYDKFGLIIAHGEPVRQAQAGGGNDTDRNPGLQPFE